jgi:hypothetical protein
VLGARRALWVSIPPLFSQDGGGSIDSKELKDLMASVGQNPTDDELAEMIRIADADGTGAPTATHYADRALRAPRHSFLRTPC